ncbi:MAG: ATP synthase F1 subunit gamma [Bryobacteraceae bacterium]
MPSLIDIRRRIRSVKNTQQITKAMKMVAAAKLRRAQDRVIAARPYAATLNKVLGDVALAARGNEEAEANPLLAIRPEKRIQVILVTSDRGLSGAFNANLIKGATVFIKEHPGATIEMETLGRKGRDFFRRRGMTITGELVGVAEKPTIVNAQAVARRVIERDAGGEIDAVYLIFNEFKSVMTQKLTEVRVLPVELTESAESPDYIYEQPPAELLGSLLPRYIETSLYRALLESAAAAFAAQMTAMDAASRNAGEVIDKLTLYMNRVRQASITREIIEVVSGAAALD